MWLSSLVLTGAISNSDDCFAKEYVIIKARYKPGLIVNPGQVLCGSRKTIKLNEEPNTIMIHASALCYVEIFKQRI
ncbi:hypothetical protein HanRHA438_Chr00c35g0856041 [Helianthus annuus]|uniref:Uncharacterized protein n=1 Tax=Helianthus annuus TaxID=4232 RepID=A0A251SN30_HELAN|nr:hypothetical protein HanXRQr2_Chr15g0692371 [Helianthus annuus]KAJ0652425.1 hypothetical protein HanOQP8_Chr15g0571991 [Helianthus annuus]KAJ0800882.1 hypothetical protein HanPI659440_Chr03g0110381 [Helianthus annuus]KAJ0831209.1 hypothetical protein HanPSC8_Chr15g0664391 [Helianthus annuus]KAJ0953992.1 hypothetical protein HanRHA438_Chr00c35g0856041 [Helianthus annuus]